MERVSKDLYYLGIAEQVAQRGDGGLHRGGELLPQRRERAVHRLPERGELLALRPLRLRAPDEQTDKQRERRDQQRRARRAEDQ